MRLRHKSWIRVSRIAVFTGLTLAALLGAFARGNGADAQAQPGPPQAPTTQCSLRGQGVVPNKATIVNALGQPIARFSGAPTPLVASDFPSDAQGKVRIETGVGAGSFRIRGFLDPTQLPLFTAANVAIAPGHVWIASNRAVTLVGSASGRLRVEKKLSAPLQQTFHGAGTCSAFSLEAGTATGSAPSGDARGYELKQESLDLYAEPNAETSIIALHRTPEVNGVLFFSTERQGDFVHLQYHAEIVVDAWAKVSALSALPPGETLDQLAPATNQHGAPQVAFQGQPKLVRPNKDVPLRHLAKEADPTIGVIEPGAETYVLDQVAGWASVLPKTMNVLPPTDGQFWAKSSDLGL
jgi:hypothetical protein